MRKEPYLSVVVCVHNEAGNIHPLIQRIRQTLLFTDYELIYVNDGSTDTTLAELRSITTYPLQILDLQKNYGQSSALAAGIDVARGKYVVTLDGDLQNDPGNILQLVQLAEQGDYDFVAGIRSDRHDHVLRRKLPSRLAGLFISWVMNMQWVDYGCSLKIIRAELAKRLMLYGELHRLMPVLAHIEGARMIQVPVQHHPRQYGQSKYGLNRIWKVICDVILLLFRKKYLQNPMHLFGGCGLINLTIGLACLGYWLVQLMVSRASGTYTMLLIGILCLLAGLQFIGIGFLADIHMRTYYETQHKKPYVVRDMYMIDSSITKYV